MKSTPSFTFTALAVSILIWTPRAAVAEAPVAAKPTIDDFLRFVEDDDAGKLQTSVATYVNEAGAVVQLVGAVHIGDAEYYADLNKVFAGYDALLFEMIGGRDGLEKKDMEGTGPLRMLQGMMGRALELDFQLEGIDYTAKNFRHADMDAATFSKKIKKQGLSMFALMSKASKWEAEQALKRKKEGKPAAEIGLVDLIKSLVFGGGGNELKLVLGRQFGDLNGFLVEMEDEGAVIIGERNAVALKVLKSALEDGMEKVGIFYGAAHLPDMETKLAEMGFKRTAIEWKTAWFVPKKDGVLRDEDGEEADEDEGGEAKSDASKVEADRERIGRHRKVKAGS